MMCNRGIGRGGGGPERSARPRRRLEVEVYKTGAATREQQGAGRGEKRREEEVWSVL